MKKTTVKEYDKEGKLIKETITEEEENQNMPVHIIPYCPGWLLPATPNTPWYKYEVEITCGSSQKG